MSPWFRLPALKESRLVRSGVRRLFEMMDRMHSRLHINPVQRPRLKLLAKLPKNSIGAELGVQHGDFSVALLRETRPTELHLIDGWWTFGQAEWNWEVPERRRIVSAVAKLIKRLEDELVSGTVKLHIGSDLDILPQFADAYFDWVYLDTSHSYKQTAKELVILHSKVKPNGLIAGDDWREDPNHPHHGVKVAVEEFMASHDYELIHQDDEYQWCIQRR